MYTNVLCSIFHKRQKVKISRNERIDETSHIHIMEYYSEQNKVQTHTTIWVNLKNITLSEIGQTQKDKYCLFHLCEIPRIGIMYRDRR